MLSRYKKFQNFFVILTILIISVFGSSMMNQSSRDGLDQALSEFTNEVPMEVIPEEINNEIEVNYVTDTGNSKSHTKADYSEGKAYDHPQKAEQSIDLSSHQVTKDSMIMPVGSFLKPPISINAGNSPPVAQDDSYSIDEEKELVGFVNRNDTDVDNSTQYSDGLDNGNFETGSLSPWTTGTDAPAGVSSGSYYRYGGSYGLRLADYDSTTLSYYSAYIEQSVYIGVDNLNEISFYMVSGNKDVTLTVQYEDGTSRGFTFQDSLSWVKHSVNLGSLDSGKVITNIKLEREGGSTGTATAIDNIVVSYTGSLTLTDLIYSVITDVNFGTLVLNNDGRFTYTPDTDFSGIDSFIYNATDNIDFDTATVTITVNNVNDSPVAQDDSFNGDEDTEIIGDVNTNDSDVDNSTSELSYEIISDVSSGTLVFNSNGTFSYSPVIDFFGTDSFVYNVTDGLEFDTATVILTINPINDAPVAQDDQFEVDEDTQFLGDVGSNDSDTDNTTIVENKLVNDDFETGTLSPWTGSGSIYGGNYLYEGSYGLGFFSNEYAEQLITAPVNKLEEVSFYMKSSVNNNVTLVLFYSDGSNSTFTLPDTSGAWVKRVIDLTELTSGETIVKLRFQRQEATSGIATAIDNVVVSLKSEVSYSLVTDVTSGLLILNTDGTFTYTPEPDFVGTDSFVYQISDGQYSDTGIVTITINNVNDAPVAQNDTFEVDEDTQLTGDVSTNDSDVDNSTSELSFSLITDTSAGILILYSNGSFSYSPDPNFFGADVFVYNVTDGLDFNTATVNLTINPINDAPVAQDDSYSTNEDIEVVEYVGNNDADIDNSSIELSYSMLTDVSFGTLILNINGSFTYIPNAEFSGTDSFTYNVTDGEYFDTATVTLTINPVNDAPVARDDEFTINEDSQLVGDISTNDNDVDNSTSELIYSLINDVSSGILVLYVNGTFTYHPTLDFFGNDSFTYQVSDGSTSVESNVLISVIAVNDSPVANDDSYSTNEDTEVLGFVGENDTDVDDSLLYSDGLDNGDFETGVLEPWTTDPVDRATVTSGSYYVFDGSYGMRLAYYNTSTLAYSSAYIQQSVYIGVDNLNVISFYMLSSNQDVILTVEYEDGTSTVIIFQSTSIWRRQRVDPGQLETGKVITNIKLARESGVSSVTTAIDKIVVDFTGGVIKSTLDYSVISDVSAGTLVLNTDGSFIYTPNTDFVGVDSFTYNVTDGEFFDTATVTLLVTAVNDAPIAQDDSFEVDEDTELSGDVSTNDSDVDNSTSELSYAVFTDVSSGMLVLNSDGSFTYTPNSNFFGMDSFVYQVSDGQLTDTGTVTLSIVDINDAPVAQDDNFEVDEDSQFLGNVGSNDSDSDNATIVENTIVNGDFETGTLSPWTGSGEIYSGYYIYEGSYGLGFFSSGYAEQLITAPVNKLEEVSFYMKSSFNNNVTLVIFYSDGSNSTFTFPDTSGAWVKRIIDLAELTSGETIVKLKLQREEAASGVATAIDNVVVSLKSEVSYSLVTDVTSGQLTLNNDGSFTYTPDPDYLGTDSFVYQISDGQYSDTGTVTLTITNVNDAPIAQDDNFDGDEDTQLSGDVGVNDSDIDNSTSELSYSVFTDVSSGILVLNSDGSFTYTPNSNYFGMDSFVYQVSDGQLTDTGTVTLNIVNINDSPVGLDDSFEGEEDIQLLGDASTNDYDIDTPLNNLIYSLVTDVSSGTLILNSDGTFSYTPETNFAGIDSFTYNVTDGEYFDIATVTITIDAVSDTPVAQDDSFEGDEDALLTGDVSLNDFDIDNSTIELSFSIITDVENGTLDFTSDGSFTYSPAPDYFGIVSFTYSVSDGTSSSTAVVSLKINNVNDSPVALDDRFEGVEDISLSGDLRSNDSDIDNLMKTESRILNGDFETGGLSPWISSGEIHGGYYIYEGSFGLGFFSNDYAEQPLSAKVDQIQELSFYMKSSYNNNVTLVIFYADGSNSTFVFSDTSGDWVKRSIDLLELDSGKTIVKLRLQRDEARSGIATAIDNVVVELAREVNYSVLSDVESGTLVLYVNGTFTYTPDENFFGTDSFTYILSDGELSDSATVILAIVGVNDAPIGQDDQVTTNEDMTILIDVLSNDQEVEGEPLSISISTAPTQGSIVVNANQTITYTPDPNSSGEDSFTYLLSDGKTSVTVLVTITINPVNDAPRGEADRYSVISGQLIVGTNSGVLINDTDIDGDAIQAILVDTTLHGKLELASDGSFSYLADAGFEGEDSFTYAVSDSTVTSDPITVVLEVEKFTVTTDPPTTDPPTTTSEPSTSTTESSNGQTDASFLDFDLLGIITLFFMGIAIRVMYHRPRKSAHVR